MLSNDQQKQLSIVVQQVVGEALKAINAGPPPTCVNCIYFNETDEICRLDPGQRRPPARVIANGCPSYEHDDIPF